VLHVFSKSGPLAGLPRDASDPRPPRREEQRWKWIPRSAQGALDHPPRCGEAIGRLEPQNVEGSPKGAPYDGAEVLGRVEAQVEVAQGLPDRGI